MRLHRNAKTTPVSRQLLVRRRTQEGWTAAAVADAHGVSARTVYKWQARARRGGLAELDDGSSRPLAQPRLTPAERFATTIGLRGQRLIGRAIAAAFAADQRESRTLHSNRVARVGVRQTL